MRINTFSPPLTQYTSVVGDTQCTVTGLSANTRYDMQIEAQLGDSTSLGLCRRIYAGASPSFVANSFSPTDILTSDSVRLQWRAVNPMADILHYSVYFGTDMPPTLFQPFLTDSFLSVKPIDGWADGVEYYWQIAAWNSADTTYGPLLQFVHQNLSLLALEVSSGTLSPAFDPVVLAYSDTVDNSMDSISVMPSAQWNGVSITVDGTPVESDSSSPNIPLPEGNTIMTVRVAAQEMVTYQDYTISVHRKSSDAFLSDLMVSDGTLNPLFVIDSFSYQDTVSDRVNAIRFRPTARQANATILINGLSALSGMTSDSFPIQTGDNNFVIAVNAEDTTNSALTYNDVHKFYTINVVRPISTNASLSGLTVSSGALSPVFSPDSTSYIDTVQSNVDTLFVLATLAHDSATMMINDISVLSGSQSPKQYLNFGLNSGAIRIEINAEETDASKTYLIDVYRMPAVPVLAGIHDTTLDAGESFPSYFLDNIYTDLDVNNSAELDWSSSAWSGLGANTTITPVLDLVTSFPALFFTEPVGAGAWYGRDTIQLMATDPFGLSDTVSMVFSKAGWRSISTISDFGFYSICFPDDSTGYIAGIAGALFKTTDHGLNWIALNTGNSYNYNAVFFIDSLRGWITGSLGYTQQTVDGGVNWMTADGGIPHGDAALKSLFFCDSVNGWAVGDYFDSPSMIYKTSDGRNWQVADDNQITSTMNSVWAFSPDSVIMVGDLARIYRTEDGGATWTSIASSGTGENLNSVFFIEDTGWIVGNGGYYAKSIDRGLSWTRGGFTGTSMTSIHFSDSQTGFCSAYNGNVATVYRTTDGGTTWTDVSGGSLSSPANSLFSFGKYDVITTYSTSIQRYMVQLNPSYP
ncbi:MAG: hypothetical protein A2293_08235 [Elusimicrobia bacterium RIFOXYB2_FULL_49_7]|nr:MAG: hypothetical protein A2293_08235 [Elusimicrobia bacterium RIFOXYB2_FULL_49_7]